jgi:ribosomal protein L40E
MKAAVAAIAKALTFLFTGAWLFNTRTGGLPVAANEGFKSVVRCAQCSAEIDFDASLCPKCGFRFGGGPS